MINSAPELSRKTITSALDEKMINLTIHFLYFFFVAGIEELGDGLTVQKVVQFIDEVRATPSLDFF